MSDKWISDSRQRHSKRYLAVLHGLSTGEPVEHLTRLQAVPMFSISFSDDLDKRQRHVLHSREWREGKL